MPEEYSSVLNVIEKGSFYNRRKGQQFKTLFLLMRVQNYARIHFFQIIFISRFRLDN